MPKSKQTLDGLNFYITDKYYNDVELKLDANENVFGPPKCILDAFKNIDLKRFNLYPCYGKLIDLLAKKFSFKEANFLLTNGCDEALSVLIDTFLDKDEELLSYSPAFSMPKIYTKQSGNIFKEVKYKTRWEFDVNYLSSFVVENTKIIYLTTPNNPTGDLIKVDDVKLILDKFSDKLIILDCTYINYSSISENEYYDLVKEHSNLAVVKSFSKDFALAGLRLGFILSSPEIIFEMKKVISPYSVNSFAVYAGETLMQNYDVLKEIKDKVTISREYLTNQLRNLGYTPYESEANFILCDFGSHKDFIYQKLLNASIAVRQFSDDELKTCLRISVPPINDAERIINLLKPKKLLVFDLDGVVFDVSNSYRAAIQKTFSHFAGFLCTESEMQAAKNKGGLSNDWDLTMFLLNKDGFNPPYDELIDVFQNYFYNKDNLGSKGLIDNEKNVLDATFFEKLSKEYDLAVFTGRPKEEAFYSLEKFGLKRYFSYFVCNEDVPEGCGKPCPDGLIKIKTSCPFVGEICFFGDTVDDIKSAVDAGVKVCGVVAPGILDIDDTIRCLKDFGANIVLSDAREILTSNLK